MAREFRYLGNRIPLDQPMPSELSFFGGPRSADLEVIALLAIAATVFVHCNLLRRTWFLAFLAVTAVIQLCLVFAFLGIDLDRREFRLFASTDVLAFVGLAFCLEKLVSLRKHERIRLEPLMELTALQRDGLIDRHSDPLDGRRVFMTTLTDKGRRAMRNYISSLPQSIYPFSN